MLLVLITDCHDHVKFLNTVYLPLLEQSIETFRNNIFDMQQRKQIPYLIYQVVEREFLLAEEFEATSGSESDGRQSVAQLTVNTPTAEEFFETAKQIY